MSALPFIEPFPPATRDDWMKLVDKVLKGADFEKKLVNRTYDGIRIEPLYAKATGKAPMAGRAPGAPWAILQRVDEPDTAAANQQALTDLENGATGLSLVFKGAPQAFGFGIDDKADAVAQALDGVGKPRGTTNGFHLSLAHLVDVIEMNESKRAALSASPADRGGLALVAGHDDLVLKASVSSHACLCSP